MHTRPIDISKPQDTDEISAGDDEIRASHNDVRERLSLDHHIADNLDTTLPDADGRHKKLTMKSIDYVMTEEDKNILYTQKVDGKPELFYTDSFVSAEDGAIHEIQLTTKGKLSRSKVGLCAFLGKVSGKYFQLTDLSSHQLPIDVIFNSCDPKSESSPDPINEFIVPFAGLYLIQVFKQDVFGTYSVSLGGLANYDIRCGHFDPAPQPDSPGYDRGDHMSYAEGVRYLPQNAQVTVRGGCGVTFGKQEDNWVLSSLFISIARLHT